MENTDEKKEEGVIKLTPYEEQLAGLTVFLKDYRSLVVTKDNKTEMNEKRLVLYRKRIAIQRVIEANKTAILKLKKADEEKGNKLVNLIWECEGDIENKIKVIDNAEAKAKADEEARKKKHQANINGFATKLIEAMKISDPEVLKEKVAQCKAWHATYNAEEFKAELDTVVLEYTQTIEAIIPVKEAKLATPAVEQPKAAEIPRMFKDHPRPEGFELPHQIKNTAPASDSTRMYPVTPDECFPAPTTEPTLEDRAKSGEFSTQVSANYEYSGYRFYVDTRIPPQQRGLICEAIRTHINNIAF